jgi:hypothetical protein
MPLRASPSCSRQREEFGGNWYFAPDYQIEGWLCPALFKYFEASPDRIFVQVKPKSAEPGAAPDPAGR